VISRAVVAVDSAKKAMEFLGLGLKDGKVNSSIDRHAHFRAHT
jgi:hypothetical protein